LACAQRKVIGGAAGKIHTLFRKVGQATTKLPDSHVHEENQLRNFGAGRDYHAAQRRSYPTSTGQSLKSGSIKTSLTWAFKPGNTSQTIQ